MECSISSHGHYIIPVNQNIFIHQCYCVSCNVGRGSIGSTFNERKFGSFNLIKLRLQQNNIILYLIFTDRQIASKSPVYQGPATSLGAVHEVQQLDFPIGISSADAVHIADVGPAHADAAVDLPIPNTPSIQIIIIVLSPKVNVFQSVVCSGSSFILSASARTRS